MRRTGLLLLLLATGCSSSPSGEPDAGDAAVTDAFGSDGPSGDASVDASDGSTTCGSPDAGAPTSCATTGPGRSNCGASSESCCTSLPIPGGTFNRTYTNAGDGGTNEGDPATISGFRLDKYDVTVGRFRGFVSAWNGGAGYLPAAGSGKHVHLNCGAGLVSMNTLVGPYEPGWDTADNANVSPTSANLQDNGLTNACTWTDTPGSQENLPINCVNWYEAYAFCIWDGGFLPSEAEWEYAAAGGAEQREYPWGATAPGTSNQYGIYGDSAGNCYYPSGTLASCSGVANIAAVGTATSGAGRWGQLDLAGNMAQWMYDGAWDIANFNKPCTDCAYPYTGPSTSAENGWYQGGGYVDTASIMATSDLARATNFKYARTSWAGFRCARVP